MTTSTTPWFTTLHDAFLSLPYAEDFSDPTPEPGALERAVLPALRASATALPATSATDGFAWTRLETSHKAISRAVLSGRAVNCARRCTTLVRPPLRYSKPGSALT